MLVPQVERSCRPDIERPLPLMRSDMELIKFLEMEKLVFRLLKELFERTILLALLNMLLSWNFYRLFYVLEGRQNHREGIFWIRLLVTLQKDERRDR